jgi:hypothetical protein
MTPTDFLPVLENTLQHKRTPFSRAALQAFVEATWPLIDDNPDVDYWADRFLESGAVEVPA